MTLAPLPTSLSAQDELRTFTLSHDALVSAYDAARAACTDARWLKPLASAYEYLTVCAVDGIELVFDAEARMKVESDDTPDVFYWPNGTCQCEAHRWGNPCWHRAARQLAVRALFPTLCRGPQPIRGLRYAASLRDVQELFN